MTNDNLSDETDKSFDNSAYQNVEKAHKIGTDDRFYNKLTELFSKRYLLSEGEKEDIDNYNTSEDRRRIEYLYVLFRSPEEYLPKQVEVE